MRIWIKLYCLHSYVKWILSMYIVDLLSCLMRTLFTFWFVRTKLLKQYNILNGFYISIRKFFVHKKYEINKLYALHIHSISQNEKKKLKFAQYVRWWKKINSLKKKQEQKVNFAWIIKNHKTKCIYFLTIFFCSLFKLKSMSYQHGISLSYYSVFFLVLLHLYLFLVAFLLRKINIKKKQSTRIFISSVEI